MQEILFTTVHEILELIIYLVFLYLANQLRVVATKTLNTEVKRNLAADAVAFVEQVYKTLHGQDKKNEALKKLSNDLNAAGIPYSVEELDELIEAAVGAFNQVFKKDTEQPLLPETTVNNTVVGEANNYTEAVALALTGGDV